MKTQFATAGLLGALLLPLAGYGADKAPSASPASPNETAGSDGTKAAKGHGSAQPVDDTVITTKVKSAYAKDKLVKMLKIEVTTVNGVVELGGEAKTRQEADKAVSLARKVKGVKSVKNNITVAGVAAGTTTASSKSAATGKDGQAKTGRSDQPVDDTWITTKVKSIFATDKDVSALNIEVKTVNGVVELGGTAKSKGEMDKAVSLARGVEGVKSVKNNIRM